MCCVSCSSGYRYSHCLCIYISYELRFCDNIHEYIPSGRTIAGQHHAPMRAGTVNMTVHNAAATLALLRGGFCCFSWSLLDTFTLTALSSTISGCSLSPVSFMLCGLKTLTQVSLQYYIYTHLITLTSYFLIHSLGKTIMHNVSKYQYEGYTG